VPLSACLDPADFGRHDYFISPYTSAILSYDELVNDPKRPLSLLERQVQICVRTRAAIADKLEKLQEEDMPLELAPTIHS
jgi:hypothetical protein